jgi:hypothetical protein
MFACVNLEIGPNPVDGLPVNLPFHTKQRGHNASGYSSSLSFKRFSDTGNCQKQADTTDPEKRFFS